MRKSLVFTTIGCASLLAGSAYANTMTFDTAPGAMVGGNTVGAEAILTTGPGTLSITLRNTMANPNTVGQSLSAFGFTLSGSPTAASLTSGTVDSATPRTVASNGTYTDGANLNTASLIGWVLSGASASWKLDVLSGGGAGPSHTLIGAPGPGNVYSTGGSIAGNGPHNPFLANDLVLQLNVTGVTAATIVNSVFFQFGTTDSTDFSTPGFPPQGRIPDSGATVLLLGSALSGLALLRRKLS